MPLSFEYSSVVPLPIETVWNFHAAEGALEKMIPKGAPVRVKHYDYPPGVASRAELEISILGFKALWIARHTVWEPPYLFADEQERGPFRSWLHQHRFESVPEGTKLTDAITLSLPGGNLVDKLFGWLLKPLLRKTFRERHDSLRRLLLENEPSES
jgi:ligand-binding SRPBCC domain-containing protein